MYQVASRSIQLFGHNRHVPKIGGGAAVPLLGGSWVPSNTMWPGLRPTSTPSGILIHPTIWPQYTNVADRQDRTEQTDNGPIGQGKLLYKGSPKNHNDGQPASGKRHLIPQESEGGGSRKDEVHRVELTSVL